MKFISFLLIACTQSSVAFTALHIGRDRKHQHTRNEPMLHLQMYSSKTSDILLDVSQLKNSNIQLWLDLRETDVPPHTALGHITSEVWEKSRYIETSAQSSSDKKMLIVDKVLTRKESNVDRIMHDVRQYKREVGLMVLEQDSIHEISDSGIMLPCGKVVNVEMGKSGITKLNADPMPVLDSVSKGDWVVLDADEDVDNGSLSSLVEVVSDGVDAFGVFDGSCDKSSLALSSGGIGLSCSTQSSVLEMSTLISSLNKRKKYELTESGIITQSESSTHECNGTAYAIVMPFDALLWKTSSFFLLQ